MLEGINELKSGSWGQEIKDAAGISVVYFWAPWCGHCQAFAPTVEAVASEMTGKARFAKVNCDEQANIVSECGINGTPTVIIYKDGREVDRHTGAESKESLTRRISGHLA
jgi:thioredoxin 1